MEQILIPGSVSPGRANFDQSHGHGRQAMLWVPDTWAQAWEASQRRGLCTASPPKKTKTLIIHRQQYDSSDIGNVNLYIQQAEFDTQIPEFDT